MSRDELADRLAEVAAQLVGRVRDDEPEANHRWLRSQVQPDQYEALIVILAAAVPIDRTWSQLTSWTWLKDFSDGRPDTPEKQALRRAALNQEIGPRRRRVA